LKVDADLAGGGPAPPSSGRAEFDHPPAAPSPPVQSFKLTLRDCIVGLVVGRSLGPALKPPLRQGRTTRTFGRKSADQVDRRPTEPFHIPRRQGKLDDPQRGSPRGGHAIDRRGLDHENWPRSAVVFLIVRPADLLRNNVAVA
jgi:hypothetical protein